MVFVSRKGIEANLGMDTRRVLVIQGYTYGSMNLCNAICENIKWVSIWILKDMMILDGSIFHTQTHVLADTQVELRNMYKIHTLPFYPSNVGIFKCDIWAPGHFALGLKGSSQSSISKIHYWWKHCDHPTSLYTRAWRPKEPRKLKGYYKLKWSPPWHAMIIVSRFIISCVESTSKRWV